MANPNPGGINLSAQVGQMQKFAGADFAGSTLVLGAPVALAAADSYKMKVFSPRSVVVTLKLEPLNQQTTAIHTGGSTWQELCFDFTGVAGNVTGYTLIFDNGDVGDAGNDPANWTFQFDDIEQQVGSCPAPPPPPPPPGLGPLDFEPAGLGGAYAWTVFENVDNPPLEIIPNPDASGINPSATVAQFTARQAGAPVCGGQHAGSADVHARLEQCDRQDHGVEVGDQRRRAQVRAGTGVHWRDQGGEYRGQPVGGADVRLLRQDR